jgi:hypothetical protein
MKQLLLMAVLLGCAQPGAPSFAFDPPACEEACANLKSMGCALGAGDCLARCRTIEADGVGFVSCTRYAWSCWEANACGEPYTGGGE